MTPLSEGCILLLIVNNVLKQNILHPRDSVLFAITKSGTSFLVNVCNYEGLFTPSDSITITITNVSLSRSV